MSDETCVIEVREGVQRYCRTHGVAFEVGMAKTPPETCCLGVWVFGAHGPSQSMG